MHNGTQELYVPSQPYRWMSTAEALSAAITAVALKVAPVLVLQLFV